MQFMSWTHRRDERHLAENFGLLTLEITSCVFVDEHARSLHVSLQLLLRLATLDADASDVGL